MERTGYNKNDIKMLYEINKTTEIAADTAIGNTDSIEIKNVVKQGSIFVPKMCGATTVKVNAVGEKLYYKHGETGIGMSIYRDDTSVAGGPEEVKKRNKEMCKNGSGKENEIQQNKVYGSKDKQRKGRRYFRISESRVHSKNQEIQILRNHNK